jgi:hypothetical protein
LEDDGPSFLATYQSTEDYGHNPAVAGVLKAYLGERWKPQPNPKGR